MDEREANADSTTSVFRLSIVGAVLLFIFSFNALTLREGHSWGDDFAMYIHHAENIALHKPYADTGYVYNIRESWYGPRSYPPVFPLLLSPVVAFRGLDLKALKLEEVAALTAALGLIYLLFRRDLGFGYTIALIAVFGLNPVVWQIRENIISDLPFFFLFLLTVYLAEKAKRHGGRGLLWGVITGFVLYLAYGTRNVGAVILAGLALFETVRYRRFTTFLGCTGVSAVLLMGAQHYVLKTQEASYADQFHTSLGEVVSNVHAYVSVLASFWPPSAGRPIAYFVFALVTALSIYGGAVKIRRSGLRALECCLLVYMPVILIWPGNQGMRFLLPLLPLYLSYAFIGMANLRNFWEKRAERLVAAAVLAATALLYVAFYSKQNYETIRETTGLKTFNELCRYLRSNTTSNDVFVFYRARALSLFADRPASVYFLDGTPDLYDEQWNYVRKIKARYIIYSPLFETDRDFLRPVLARHAAETEAVYKNPDFTVFQVRD